MPSNDERRQVAARLRSVSGAPEWATTACCIAECLGEHDYPLWDDSKPLFNRLADLIEPEPERTCRIIWNETDETWECDSCGGAVGFKEVCYCESCGAKVIE